MGVSAVALLLYSMDKCRMCSEKWHNRATLHTSQSWRLCCIAGLEPGIVSNSSSAFHVLRCSSSSVSLVSLLLSADAAYASYSYSGAVKAYGVSHIMLRFEMTTLLMSRTSFDGTGISIHHLLFSPLDHCIHLDPPSQPILCHVRPFSTNTLCHCLLPSPHPEPPSMAL